MKTITDIPTELTYILSIDLNAVGDTFNNDVDCFVRYVRMQADKMVELGDCDSGIKAIKYIQSRFQ